MDEVTEFIRRRFKTDCKWTDGNCYYFAVILVRFAALTYKGVVLKARFPSAEIYYEVILGHFLAKINGRFYDYKGVFKPEEKSVLIPFDNLERYDRFVYKSVIEGCVL